MTNPRIQFIAAATDAPTIPLPTGFGTFDDQYAALVAGYNGLYWAYFDSWESVNFEHEPKYICVVRREALERYG